jgi:hypothetical protein
MRKYDNEFNNDKSLSTGIAAFFSGFLFFGGSALIYFLKLHNSNLHIIEIVFLWIATAILFLSGICLFIWGIVVIIYNISLIIKKHPRPKCNDNVYVNTHPLAGLIALIVSIVFTLALIFFIYPQYKEGTYELVGLLFFIVSAAVLFLYSIFVFIYNLIKKNK